MSSKLFKKVCTMVLEKNEANIFNKFYKSGSVEELRFIENWTKVEIQNLFNRLNISLVPEVLVKPSFEYIVIILDKKTEALLSKIESKFIN